VYLVGGFDKEKNQITLCSIVDNKRLCRTVKPNEIKFLAYNKYMCSRSISSENS
jgi:hypothetical protein